MQKEKKGFTLIELLVVISIIALLLSILMPSLQKVKRSAKIVVCGTRLKQIGLGMTLYAQDNEGKYLNRSTGYPRLVYYTEAQQPDFRELVRDYIASGSPDIMFCPVRKKGAASSPGIDSTVQRVAVALKVDHWGEFFWLANRSYGGSPIAYQVGYNIFGGLKSNSGYGSGIKWLWENSGNKSQINEPRIAGSSRDIIAADCQESWQGLGNPYRSNHSLEWEGGGFLSSNSVYGDGHIEKHTKLNYYVERRASGPTGYFEY